MPMTTFTKRWVLLSVLAAIVGGVGLAAYELYVLQQAIAVAESVAESIAAGLGGASAEKSVTVSVSLLLGMIPVGPVDHPYLVIAIGDFVLGALITGAAMLIVYLGIVRLRRRGIA